MKDRGNNQLLITSQMSKTTHCLIIGDALKVLADKRYFADESVNLVVTSPPYGLRKKYGDSFLDSFDLKSWIEMIEIAGKQVWRILKPNGSFFLNVSPIPHPKTKEMISNNLIRFVLIQKLKK